VTDPARTLDLVRRYQDAAETHDPARYEPFLTDDPVLHGGMTTRRGRAAFAQSAAAGAAVYPFGALRITERRVVVEGDWVAVLAEREAVTGAGAHYENTYGMFYEVRDDHIATQVELLDFRVAAEKLDLAAAGAVMTDPGVTRAPVQVAALPDPDDDSPSAAAKRTVLTFLDAFLTFDPDRYTGLLAAEPFHQVGVSRRPGRRGFDDLASAGRILYPERTVERVHHVLVSDGRTVATLCTLRARTHLDVAYENLYGMFFDVHDGTIVTMIEVLDGRVAAAAFDLSVLDD
jgi:ketosteroid isomerase-like protein